MLKRSLLGFVAFSVVGIVVLLVMFFSWRSDIVDAREADKDRRIVSTALGSIEYASVGKGIPVLALHGTPGGYDQVLASRRALPHREFGYRTIAVSTSRYASVASPISSTMVSSRCFALTQRLQADAENSSSVIDVAINSVTS